MMTVSKLQRLTGKTESSWQEVNAGPEAPNAQTSVQNAPEAHGSSAEETVDVRMTDRKGP